MVSAVLLLALGLADPAAAQQGEIDLRRHEAVVQPGQVVLLRAQVLGPLLVEGFVEEGQMVETGELLAEVDSVEQQVAVESARLQADQQVQIDRADKVVEEMEIRLQQAEELLERGAGTRTEVRQAKVQRDLSAIDVLLAKRDQKLAVQRLNIEESKLKKYRLTAPFAGRVVRIEAKGGQVVEPGDEVLTLAALDELEAPMWLPVSMFAQLKTGQRYRLVASDPVSQTLTGTVKYVDPVLDSASRTFRVVFTIDNADQVLPAGFVVWLEDGEPLPEQAIEAGSEERSDEGPDHVTRPIPHPGASS